MDKEYEVRILEIDKDKIIKKLETLGAEKVRDVTMERLNFNGPIKGSFLRLRNEGDKVTLTYKYRKYENNLEDTTEIETEVGDFDTLKRILEAMGHKPESYQQQKKIDYLLDGITFTIDTWPHIPTYLEVEANSHDEVQNGIKILGYSKKDCCHLAGLELFKKYGFSPEECKDLRF